MLRFSARAGSVLAAALIGLGAAHAAPSPPPGELSAVDAQRQARALDRDADRDRAHALAGDIDRLRRQLVAMGSAEASGERHVGGARAALRKVNLEEAALKVKMGRNQQSLTRLLGALQMFQRDPPPPLLVDARSARDAVRATILIRAIMPELQARAKTFAAQSEALKRVRRRADAASGALFTAESDVADRQARMEDLIEQKRALEKQLYADADAADADIRRLALKARSLGELVDVLDSRRAAGPDADPEADVLPRSFLPPVQGTLERRFGERGADRLRIDGMTWSTDPGAAVRSPAAATVDYAGPLKDWGVVVILRIGDHHLVLAGLSGLSVDTGRTVAAGEPIGQMPQGPGRPELYFEVRRGATPVDPARWFPAPPVLRPPVLQSPELG